jgi:integration host factor subunit alpha
MLEDASTCLTGRAQVASSAEGGEGAVVTRQSIVRAAADHMDLSQRQIKRLVDAVIEEMTAALARGETVKLHDFGSFVVRGKGLRSGRNPRTGQRVPIEPRKVVIFKASPSLKDAINTPRPAEGRAPPSGQRIKAR